MGWRRVEERTLGPRFRSGGGRKFNNIPWRKGAWVAMTSSALNQTLSTLPLKVADSSTKVMHWAEDLRGRGMKK